MSTYPTRLVGKIKRYVRSSKPFWLVNQIRSQLRLARAQKKEETVVSLRPMGKPKGVVLLSYFLNGFMLAAGQPVSNSHTNYTESLVMADTFLALGYEVEAISFRNRSFRPEKPYALVVDVRWNLQRLAPLLNPDCLKSMHVDTCHYLFGNANEANRLLAIQQRRGVTLQPRRFEFPNLAIETADFATVLGNDFTLETYRYAHKPLYRVPILSLGIYDWPAAKDFESCRKRYVWFGSGGLVRKGLDLVLEAFVAMPDYHLTICGPISEDDDFERAYFRELYQTSNIETVGWVDIHSPKFQNICDRATGIVYASAGEGQCGGVVTCMHAGLIPIVSYETGIDMHEYGVIFRDCSIREIQDTVRRISDLPTKEREQMARGAWEYARANHTKERFSAEYRQVMERVLLGNASRLRSPKSTPAMSTRERV